MEPDEPTIKQDNAAFSRICELEAQNSSLQRKVEKLRAKKASVKAKKALMKAEFLNLRKYKANAMLEEGEVDEEEIDYMEVPVKVEPGIDSAYHSDTNDGTLADENQSAAYEQSEDLVSSKIEDAQSEIQVAQPRLHREAIVVITPEEQRAALLALTATQSATRSNQPRDATLNIPRSTIEKPPQLG